MALRTMLGVSALLLAGLGAAVRPVSAAQPSVASQQQQQQQQPASFAELGPQQKQQTIQRLEALYERYAAPGDMDPSLQALARAQAAQQDQAEPGARGIYVDTEALLPDEYEAEVAQRPPATLPGDVASTSWSAGKDATELSYPQFWALVNQGHVERVHFPGGPSSDTLVALLGSSAPGGGGRTVSVPVAPDPQLLDHLTANGVEIEAESSEAQRLENVLSAQIMKYTIPFFFMSAFFWLLHSWVLDPAPNAFKRQEFIRHRREMLYITSKLNFRSPAREVRIDRNAPDFISWEDISGIDSVKREIEEVIEYLQNPALMRQQGIARIGGLLLAGAPGTGKTLLAKAIAAESGVRMFTCSGTDFVDVYSGVGARRIRETFDRMRKNGPAILFVDEFDALGAARGTAVSGDESASIINELLVQMDGFEDNNGVIVLGATNRPGAIDSALIRPGRFDRIIYMPLPDAAGRAKILQVHARDKRVDPNLNWLEVARAMSGFTGADCMGLMLRAAGMAARQGRDVIEEEDLYAAMENKAMESFSEMTNSPKPGQDAGVPNPIPAMLRKAIAVYEAGKVLTAYITPEFEEIARVSICPCDLITGYTLFMEDEGKTIDSIVTRGDLESHIVVNLAGYCAEKLVMGEAGVTSLGASDAFQANMIAREMVLSMGMGRRMGPVDLMHVTRTAESSDTMLRSSDLRAPDPEYFYHASDMSTEQARVAMAEVLELLEAGEAKAYYGLATNWKPLQALAQALLDRGVLSGKEVAFILESNGVVHFPDPYMQGFGWDKRDGTLLYPLKPARPPGAAGAAREGAAAPPPAALKGVKAKTWFAGTPLDAPRDENGNFLSGWHWNMPYTVKRSHIVVNRQQLEKETAGV